MCLSRSLTFSRHLTLNKVSLDLTSRRASAPTNTRSRSKHTSTSNNLYPRYKPIEDIEPFERYTAGGYCPIQIGDCFHSSRYQVVHKLRFGASSTTWIARDKHLAKYVAIKIAVSRLGYRPIDSIVLKRLWNGDRNAAITHVGTAMIPEMLDEFELKGSDIHGARGRHHCLVTTLARMSLSEA